MAIDIRAKTTCSLGSLISGEVGDNYLQGSGLISTRGSCEINGLITPEVGTRVTFSYAKNNITRNLPRSLRVLSSFADPFRRTTKVELGCKLTYLSDLQESLVWTAFDDSENNDFTEEDQRIITLPIRASSVMAKCLSELGITASNIPLTNNFSIAEFDFSGGYVQVLSDLLVSESYFGYLDTNEILQVRSLSQEGGSGPVLTSANIIDLGPIGVGQLPAEAVTVSYSSLKLKQPEITVVKNSEDEEGEVRNQLINWELDETVSSSQLYFVTYKVAGSDEEKEKVYAGTSSSSTLTRYREIDVFNPETNEKERKEVVYARFTKNYGPSISIAAPFAQQYLENKIPYHSEQIQISGTNTYYEYYDGGSNVVTIEESFKTEAEQAGSLGIDLVYLKTLGTPPRTLVQEVLVNYGLIMTELTITESYAAGDASKQVITRYKLLSDTQHGQQAIANIREDILSSSEANNVISRALSGLVFDSSSVQSRTSGRADEILSSRPKPATRINRTYSKGGDPSNGWRTENKAELELALGSATSQRRIEFSMPYAPDDVFTKLQIGGGFNRLYTLYSSVASDAPAKANRYGRVQNRLLLGNRSGISLQAAPEKIPTAPFDPVFVQAAGLTALYRTNGTQWSFDSSGIICSTDALYWGVAGKNS